MKQSLESEDVEEAHLNSEVVLKYLRAYNVKYNFKHIKIMFILHLPLCP